MPLHQDVAVLTGQSDPEAVDVNGQLSLADKTESVGSEPSRSWNRFLMSKRLPPYLRTDSMYYGLSCVLR
jgi:hypothetical protein